MSGVALTPVRARQLATEVLAIVEQIESGYRTGTC
jgi:hypothetical protein